MPNNFDAIATITLGSAGNFSFTSIPQTYKELYLIGAVRGNAGFQNCTVTVNGNNSSIYCSLLQYGQGSTAGMGTNALAGTTYCQIVNNNNFTPFNLKFFNYTSTTRNKIFMGWGGTAFTGSGNGQVRWEWNSAATTTAITSIFVGVNGGTFTTGSQLTLYGLG